MMTKQKIFRGAVVLVMLILSAVFLFILPPPITGQTPPTNCGGGTQARAEGLVTTSSLQEGSKFGTTGKCVVDQKTAFVPYKIPGYDDLKSLYFTQSKSSGSVNKHSPLSGSKTHSDILLTSGADHLYLITGDLNISSNIPGNDSQTGVVFVDGNLNISNNIQGAAGTGLVLVAKGNVNIAPGVTRIDAVIISGGKIYTAGADCSQSAVTASQLVINGSLISLDAGNKIVFCRTLSNNTNPAEVINHQPKYLVILRDLFSNTLQKWSEVQ